MRKSPPPFPSLQLKSMPVRRYSRFPTKRGLYFVYPWHGFGRCLYVGMTLNRDGFRGRWSNHGRYAQAARVGANVHFWECPRGASERQLLNLELRAKQQHRPRWNDTRIPQPHPPWLDTLGRAMDWAVVVAVVVTIAQAAAAG